MPGSDTISHIFWVLTLGNSLYCLLLIPFMWAAAWMAGLLFPCYTPTHFFMTVAITLLEVGLCIGAGRYFTLQSIF
jgi:hypothetical protein